MTELLTAAQMRAIEHAAIASGEVTGLELMERAGRGVVEAVFEEWPELAAGSFGAVVLCGPGNNGGDGFVVARLLKEWGWEVEVFLYGDAAMLPPDAQVNYERWVALGEICDIAQQPNEYADLIVDALFGIGLTRSIDLDLTDFWSRFDPEQGFDRRHRVAVDLPTGLCADSGRRLGKFGLHAELTVTFHAAKCGHYLDDGPSSCGRLIVMDIGLKPQPRQSRYGKVTETPRVELARVRRPLQKGGAHKYRFGHATVLSGLASKTGAARLSARGALRIGAGLVTLASPAEAMAENAAQVTAIMLAQVDGADDLSALLADERINAVCLGPGLGVDRGDLVAAALETRGLHPPYRATVLDADALTVLSHTKDLFAALHDRCVLTPHAGEFARLFPDIAEKLDAPATKGPAFSKVDATREAAKRAGCVVLFKGVDTVIASPDGRCSINSAHYNRAASWLATAGSGDVLAGLITGLLARGFAPMQAAETAAWLHVECARSFGPGLIAEDLPEELPKVFRALGL